jgi:hypothetical protein
VNALAAAEVIDLGKVCTKCRLRKPLGEFHAEKRRGSRRAICKDCNKAAYRDWYGKNPDKVDGQWVRKKARIKARPVPEVVSEEQRCGRCGTVKMARDFRRDQRSPSGLYQWCRLCTRRYNAHWRRHVLIEKKYGISKATFDLLLDSQGHACAICRRQFGDKRRPCVDHDHESGAARGVLCSNCNTGIGMLGDSVEVAAAAAAYLVKHKGQRP